MCVFGTAFCDGVLFAGMEMRETELYSTHTPLPLSGRLSHEKQHKGKTVSNIISQHTHTHHCCNQRQHTALTLPTHAKRKTTKKCLTHQLTNLIETLLLTVCKQVRNTMKSHISFSPTKKKTFYRRIHAPAIYVLLPVAIVP